MPKRKTLPENEARPLSEPEGLDWPPLARAQNVGPTTFVQLIRRYGSAGEALAALPEIAQRVDRGRALTILQAVDAARELEAAARYGARLVAI